MWSVALAQQVNQITKLCARQIKIRAQTKVRKWQEAQEKLKQKKILEIILEKLKKLEEQAVKNKPTPKPPKLEHQNNSEPITELPRIEP